LKAHLFTDADNTLWDTDEIFASAQLGMLREIEKLTGREAPRDEDRGLAFLREVDQKIAKAHPDHLRYPPALLAQGLAMVLGGCGVGEAVARLTGPEGKAGDEFGPVQSRFIEEIRKLPPLREGVREGLMAAGHVGIPVTIVTEETAERTCKLLLEHRLADLVVDVVSVRKTTSAYSQLKKGVGDIACYMVGDQIDKDILAASAAGFSTFYFPGGFAPYWNLEIDVGQAELIERYDEIVPAILSGNGPTSASVG
jgi:putative hydrolase of the HAD superfamily